MIVSAASGPLRRFARRLAPLLLLVVLAVLGFGWRQVAARGSAGAATTQAKPRPVSDTRVHARSHSPATKPQAGSKPQQHAASELPSARLGALDDYLASAVYPPNSRPLSQQQPDLIYPNRRHETPRKSHTDPSLSYLFTADAYWVSADQPLLIWLQAYRGDEPIAPVIERTELALVGPEGELSEPIGIELTAQQGRQQARVVLAELIEAQQPLRVRLSCRFRLAAGEVEEAFFHLVYNPPASLSARFDGRFHSEVRDGSLCIDVGVEVSRAGYYLIDANLWAGQTPIGWARFKGELSSDSTSVPLCFFGKVIVDKGLAGPYRLAQLRGARHRPGVEPDLEQMPWFQQDYQTEDFPLSAFSAAEYDSPYKQRKISMLRDIHAVRDAPHSMRPVQSLPAAAP